MVSYGQFIICYKWGLAYAKDQILVQYKVFLK